MNDYIDNFSLFDLDNSDLISLVGSIDLSIGDTDVSLDSLVETSIDYNDTLLDSLEISTLESIVSYSTSSNSSFSNCNNYDSLPSNTLSCTDVLLMNDSKNSQKPKKSKRKLTEAINQPLTVYKAPKLAPIVKKEFYQFPYEFMNAFNSGDMIGISKGFHNIMHSRCLFQINEYNDINKLKKFDGPSSIVLFFNSLINMYPDGVISIQKVKSKYINVFQVISCKIQFTGTILPGTKQTASCPEEEIERLKQDLKDNLYTKNNVLIKGKMDLYIDEESNRVVLNDVRYLKTN